MKKILYMVLLLVYTTDLFSQTKTDFEDYTPLQCSGELPEDFKLELSKLVNQAKNQKSESKVDKKQEVEFAELSNYQLTNILYSGKVLYGDKMTTYVNKVADEILKDDKELRGKLNFYILKNTDPNAYATQRGVIFVTIGLLAQIESEAQLAFILCHEIIHFKNNHNLQTYKKNEDLRNDKTTNYDKRIGNMMNYSKENELEADREGLKLFLTTKYGTNELANLFDVLLYSYLPFDELSFDSTYFNSNPGFIIPGKYFLKTCSDITAEEDVNDSLSTHPNIKKRREGIQKLLETKNNPSGLSFVLTKEEFQDIQRIARCELAIAHLKETECEDALYAAYLMEKIYGKTKFSDKIIAAALYTMSKQKNHEDESSSRRVSKKGNDDELSDIWWKNVEGQSQSVYHFSYTIPSKELNILATKKMYEGYKKYNDKFFLYRFNSLVYELVNIHDLSLDNFKKEFVIEDTTKKKVEEEIKPDEETKLSKVSKIKKKKASKTEKDEQANVYYYKYAFVNFYTDSTLTESFDWYMADKTKKEKREDDPEYQKYEEAKEKIIAKHGDALDINKMVMFSPYYNKYIYQYSYYNYLFYNYKVKDPDLSPLEEQDIENSIAGYMSEYAKKLNMSVDILGSTQQTEMTTESFNEYQNMLSWFEERLSIGKMGAYTYIDQYIKPYGEKYGYVGFCYVTNNNKALEVVFILFDLNAGGSKFIYEKEVRKGKPTGVYSKMMLYDILHQISQKPTKLEKLKKKYNITED